MLMILTGCGDSAGSSESSNAQKPEQTAVSTVQSAAETEQTTAEITHETEEYRMKIELTPGEYFREGKYYSNRFGKELTVSVELNQNVSDDAVSQCVEMLENFSDAQMNILNEAAKRYALAFIEEIKEEVGDDFSFEDEDLPEITEDTPADEMPEYFEISEVLINEPEQEGQIYFRLCGGCDWEIEHGFEAAFQDGRLVYLGAFEEATPGRVDYYINGKGREWNYAL